MKKLLVVLFGIICPLGAAAQSLEGAWERYYTATNGDQLKSVVIFSNGYQVLTNYNAKTGAFIDCNGGTWHLDQETITEEVEFDSQRPTRIGTEVSFKVSITNTTLTKLEGNIQFTKIDDGTPGALQGAWLMSGRIKNGETQERDTTLPRKTMKILSGTRFQWIAYNTATKQFMGTGGGSYTTVDGKYTENIEFFSKDNSRVGASLNFDYKLMNGDWHHSGKSSKGDPIYEIWSLRK
ncbi:membrane or secreted protein [Cellulophaga sp. L1A9]|uniref:membrane or secreted protein n=1 Tax=Cellulophaga sp. L1A9 TaxID=2686362 RepID=UPI00131CF034|nr:membrane or secreted protein [Cellulophaga sp. L1A9]